MVSLLGTDDVGPHACDELLLANLTVTADVEVFQNTSPHLRHFLWVSWGDWAASDIENILQAFRSDVITCISYQAECHFEVLLRKLDLLVDACSDELGEGHIRRLVRVHEWKYFLGALLSHDLSILHWLHESFLCDKTVLITVDLMPEFLKIIIDALRAD